MSVASELLWTYPEDLGNVDRSHLLECIDACVECAQACTVCADACLSEPDVAALIDCVRSNLDCADVCNTTWQVLSRYGGEVPNLAKVVVEGCLVACTACAETCEKHAGKHDHCRSCARACRLGEQACRELLAALG